MAVQRPVTGIVGDKLELAHLGHADQDIVPGDPGSLRNAAAFRPRDPKGMAVQVNRVVIHCAEVEGADANPIAQADDQRRAIRSAAAVKVSQ